MANSVCSAATAVNSSCILSALDHYARRGSGKYEKEALHTASKRACRPASGLEAGLWLEFGVAHGGSTKIILQQLTRSTCSVSRKKLYAFDSFLGLPETWRQPDAHVRGGENISRCCLGAGAFARKGLPPFHNPNVEWRIGWVSTGWRIALRFVSRSHSLHLLSLLISPPHAVQRVALSLPLGACRIGQRGERA